MIAGKLEAKDIMTRKVHTVRAADPIRKVIDTICRHRVSGVPVVDAKGMLALHHVKKVAPGKGPGVKGAKSLRDVDTLLARDVMVVKVITGTPGTDALRLASVMALRKIRRIPIVEGRKLVGIVSHGDLYRAIFGIRGGRQCSRRPL
jgi:CBS-domain-containing membrane protein